MSPFSYFGIAVRVLTLIVFRGLFLLFAVVKVLSSIVVLTQNGHFSKEYRF